MPTPNGRPIKYQPIINTIHTKDMIAKYGATYFRAFPIPIGFVLLSLYIFKYPTNITNDARSGVKPLVIESAALNIN